MLFLEVIVDPKELLGVPEIRNCFDVENFMTFSSFPCGFGRSVAGHIEEYDVITGGCIQS